MSEARTKYKFGHPRFYELMDEYMDLHDRKNHDYASGGDPLGNFDRVADFFAMYPGFRVDTPFGVMFVYMMKQIDAVAWGYSQNIKHKVEGLAQRLPDVTVYSVLERIALEKMEKRAAEEQVRLSTKSMSATGGASLLDPNRFEEWLCTSPLPRWKSKLPDKRRVVSRRRRSRK